MANGDIYTLNVGEGEFDVYIPTLKSLDNLVSVVGNLANEGEINLVDKPVITIRPKSYENNNLKCAYHVHFSDANTEQPQQVKLKISVFYRDKVIIGDYVTTGELEETLKEYALKEWVTEQIAQIKVGIDIKELKQTKTDTLISGWKTVGFEFDVPSDFNINTSKFWTSVKCSGDINGVGERDIYVEGNKLKVSVGVNGKRSGEHNVTCKIFYIVGASGSGSTIDTSQFVTKQESWEELCREPCEWANDLNSQIQSNRRLIDNMNENGIVSGVAFGNVVQHIATKEWVEERLRQEPSDQPSGSIDRAEVEKIVRTIIQNDSLVSYLAKNNPKDENNTFKAKYTFDGVETRGNPQLQPNAPTLKYNWDTYAVNEALGGNNLTTLNIASQEWVVPKVHAINLIYNFDGKIEKQSEDFVAYKYVVWNVKVKGFVDFLRQHWPEHELELIKKWGRVACFVPNGLMNIDWVRNGDGGTNYIDEHRTELIACSYDTNGDLILTIRVNGVADTAQYNSMINHLVLICYKFGQALLVTNDPTIDDEIDKRPITPWEPPKKRENKKTIRIIR